VEKAAQQAAALAKAAKQAAAKEKAAAEKAARKQKASKEKAARKQAAKEKAAKKKAKGKAAKEKAKRVRKAVAKPGPAPVLAPLGLPPHWWRAPAAHAEAERDRWAQRKAAHLASLEARKQRRLAAAEKKAL
jgi:hypothetical protein